MLIEDNDDTSTAPAIEIKRVARVVSRLERSVILLISLCVNALS